MDFSEMVQAQRDKRAQERITLNSLKMDDHTRSRLLGWGIPVPFIGNVALRTTTTEAIYWSGEPKRGEAPVLLATITPNKTLHLATWSYGVIDVAYLQLDNPSDAIVDAAYNTTGRNCMVTSLGSAVEALAQILPPGYATIE